MKNIAQFVIPSKIAKNFKIVGDLSNIADWKAKVLRNNSGDKKIGSWDNVGYVFISILSNEIIPIARADEHERPAGMFLNTITWQSI